MLHLRLFAAPTLDRDDVPLTGRPVQRHRIALLALLALAPGRRLSREKLIAYLWPESDTTKGRNLLKTTTYVLRSELGEATILSENDQLRLNDQVIRCDAADFDAAIAQADHLHAVGLYRGPFLDGFFLDDSPEFEEWASSERARLAGRFAAALEALAVAGEAAGNLPEAADWWCRRAAQDPYDTKTALRVIRALDNAGNRAGALQHASRHAQLLRAEFGVDTPPELSAAIAALRTPAPDHASHRAPPANAPIAADGMAADDVEPLAGAGEPIPATPVTANWTQVRAYARWAAAIPVLMLVLVAAYWFFAVRSTASAPEPALAVMPFVNMSPDSGDVYFSDGLSEQIISNLSRIPGLRVAARSSSFALRDSNLDVRANAATMGVSAVLGGSVRREGNRLRVTAQLIDARTGYPIWSADYDRELRQVVEVEDEIATEIARALELRMPARAAAPARGYSPDPQAYEFYLRALYLRDTFSRDRLSQARHYLDRAIELDPQFARAWALKATVLGPLIYWRYVPLGPGVAEARAAVTRALELDPQLGEAYGALGMVLMFFDWDFAGAERALRRAVELNPNDHHAWHHLGNYYSAMGQPAQATRARERAVAIDPLNVRMGLMLGEAYAASHRFDDGLAQFRRMTRLDPAHPMLLGSGPSAPIGPWWIYLQQGRHQDVVDEFLRIATMRRAAASEVDDLRSAFERGGLPAFWRRWLEFDMRESGGESDPVRAAIFLALAGDNAEALELLKRAHAARHPAMIYVFNDPIFAALRPLPEFQRIFGAMHFVK